MTQRGISLTAEEQARLEAAKRRREAWNPGERVNERALALGVLGSKRFDEVYGDGK